MENIYEICFYGGLILAIIFFIVSVVLFIVLKIPKAIGDLTGRTAKKSIKEMKDGASTKESVAKKEQAKYYNQSTGKIKVREGVSTEQRKENRDDTTDSLKPGPEMEFEETEILGNDTVAATDVDETEVLSEGKNMTADSDETEVLSNNEVSIDEDATDVLVSEDEDATDVLTSEDDDATDVLTSEDDDATDVLTAEDDADETDVLRVSDTDVEDEGATTVLAGGNTADKLARKYKVQYNVVVTHTDETL